MKNVNKEQDIIFIKEALRLAKMGVGKTHPNPMVGAVLVKNGVVIGKGYHRKAGLAHAEIEALTKAKTKATGATLYVSLEPCVHFGKTPPCTNTIIKAGIARVVCATLDPNPKVRGKGVRTLQKANIPVTTGILEHEARMLNEQFFFFHEKNRPFICLKFAASLDGKIATKTFDSNWITNEKARKFARNLRSQYQAILVGINTVLKDDPHLGESLRIILDSKLRTPLNAQVLRDHNVIIATSPKADGKRKKLLESKGFEIFVFDNERIPLPKLISVLTEKEIISILVEGGGKVLGSFVDEKLVDKIYAFHAPFLIGGKNGVSAVQGKGIGKLTEALSFKNVQFRNFGDNTLTIGYTN